MNSHDIARIAGVSRSTVSKVLNNYSDISPETRNKVLEVVEQHGYVPNESARLLTGKTSNIIGLFILNMFQENKQKDFEDLKIFTNSYFSYFTAVTIDASKSRNYNVLVSIASDKQDFDNIKRLFRNKTIAGGIFLGGADESCKEVYDLAAQGYKVAFIDQAPSKNKNIDKNTLFFRINNEQGAYDATKSLIDLGHTNIAHITGNPQQLSGIERLAGYKRAMKEHNLPVLEDNIKEGYFVNALAYTYTNELLDTTGPTAFFCANDLMALACMKAVKERGLKVPEDISIIGFDNIHDCEETNPPLSSIDYSFATMAAVSSDRLIEFIEKGETESHEILLPVQCVFRESCGPVKNN